MARLYNKGKRTIIYGDGEHQKIEEGKFSHPSITAEESAKLKAMFPKELVDIDNKEELQAQYEEKKPAKKAEETLTVSDHEKEKKAAVDAAVEKERAKFRELNESANVAKDQSKEENDPAVDLATRIDSMDRIGLISFIEENQLEVDHARMKHPDALKKAVFVAMQNKAVKEKSSD